LIEEGFEPALDSNPEKFWQSLAADGALWGTSGQIAWAEARLTVANLLLQR
jgi:hypothetical protein